MKVICESYNQELIDILVSHLSVGGLKPSDHSMIINTTKSLMKLTNISLTLKKNNINYVITIKQVNNVMYTYRRSQRGLRTQT